MSIAIRNDRRATIPSAMAQALGPGVWCLDPAYSAATFRVRAMGGLIGIGGRFKVLDGAIQVDEAGRPSGHLRAHAGSLDTGIRMRDRHLRSADFFDVERHPYLEFSVRELAEDRSGRMRITGELVIRGVASLLEAQATVQDAGDGTVEIAADATVEHAAVGRALKRGRVIKGPALLTARLRFARDGKAESAR